MNRPNKYRPELDGIRGLAILLVLLFHLGITWLPGGYVGVDIFFVISGYLISQQVIEGIKHNNFDFYTFYKKRIRRLFPALFVTIIATLLVSCLVLTPSHLERLGWSSISATLSLSNFFFLVESGYFDEAKLFKPLLHTWSLSVEEQFYLIWPVLIFFSFGKFARKWVYLIFVIGVLSLVLAEFLIRNNSETTAFYLMPTRVFEFALGALLVKLPNFKSPSNHLFSLLGLILIFWSGMTYTESTSFPGYTALIPCIGTCLLIVFLKGAFIYKLFANNLMVSIGKISYSLYLVHWPIIVLFSYWKLGGIGWKSMIFLVPSIFVCALLLYNFVEQPFRYKSLSTTKKYHYSNHYQLICSSLAILVITIGISLIWGNGFTWRFTEEKQRVISAIGDTRAHKEERNNLIQKLNSDFNAADGANKSYIIGDSFAEDAMLAIKYSYPKLNLKLLRIEAKCQPVLASNYQPKLKGFNKQEYCNSHRKRVFELPRLQKAQTIFLAASWREPADTHLIDTLLFLTKNTTAQIVVFGPRPTFHDVPTLALKHGKQEQMSEFINNYRTPDINNKVTIYKRHAANANVDFIDLFKLICDNKACPILVKNNKEQPSIFYFDHAHWTLSGAYQVSKNLRSPLREIGISSK